MTGVTRTELPVAPVSEMTPGLTAAQHHEQKQAATVKIMEDLHATEIFGTPELSKEFIDAIDYDGFKQYISFVNGIERDIPSSERGLVSDSFVRSENTLMGIAIEYRPPHQSFRDRLLKYSFEQAQACTEPEMAGLTLGLSINAVHYFADGNGRTSRLTYALLAKGYDSSPEHQAYYSSLLENTKGREVVDLNPAASGIDKRIYAEMLAEVKQKCGYNKAMPAGEMPTYIYSGYGDTFAGEESPDELMVADDIDIVARDRLYRTMESGEFTMISLLRAFEPERVREFVRTSPDGKRTFVDGDAFLPTLSNQDINHWWSVSEGGRYSYVQRLASVASREDAAEIAAHYRTAPL